VLAEIDFPQLKPTTLFMDAESTIKTIKNAYEVNQRNRHLDTKVHHTRDHFLNKTINLQWLPGNENYADIATKPNNRSVFTTLAHYILQFPDASDEDKPN
jgi:hypothetical protein